MWPFKRRRKPIEEIYSLIEELPQSTPPKLEVVVSLPPPVIVPMDNPRAQAMRDYEVALAAHQERIDDLKEAGGA